ncbi:salivary glue protein Sgs-3 [Drosophila takahashii]|uniref:salivary glue protein Sgs-3 n=1 Tax=Drosophila takahashii TaxID=29030 RepID=UPI001CF8D3E0|nr:predicted GPI-anchored protein 58 [Drosophila takahashii]
MFKLSLLVGLALILAPSITQAKSLCRQSGYFTLVDNTPHFYACQSTGVRGDFSVRHLRCPAGLVFSSSVAQCIPSIAAFEAREDSNIENPTIPPLPPSNLDESTSEAPVTTGKPATEAPAPTEAPGTTEKPATEAPGTTEKPATEAPGTTEKPATEAPGTTEKPATEAPGTTEKPATEAPGTTIKPATEAPETTEKPATDEPVTDDPATEEPATDEPVTDTDEPVTDEPVTDEPSSNATDDGDVTETTAEPHKCATTGFFPSDESCTNYVLCSYANGEDLKPFTMKCPQGMQFDPVNSCCDKNFDCLA